MMVDVGSESGAIDKTEQEFIQNVFEFDDLTAGEVAVHRTEVSILWLDESPMNGTKQFTAADTRFTRFAMKRLIMLSAF